eukprot:scaffold224_cov108-Skeletonema_marinoi.AAC.11
MDHTDYSYYEANAADISLETITSSEQNKEIFQQIREAILRSTASLWAEKDGSFLLKDANFCLSEKAMIWAGWGREQQIDALMDGLARNQSIRRISVIELGDYGSTSFLRALGSWSQLEELVNSCNNLDSNGCSALRTLLESGACKLKKFWLYNNNIGDGGVAALASGLRSIGPSLKHLGMRDNFIGNEGLSALVAALDSCSSLERLDLSDNDFSLATAGLGSLSEWLQTVVLDLNKIHLQRCNLNDEGLQALAEGATNHCKDLYLSGNDSITASGLRYLSTSLQTESCRLEKLHIGSINLRDDGAEVLARGLVGNKVLRCLQLRDDEDEDDIAISREGWNAFATALCDTSSVNNTYLSNHTVQELWHVRHEFDEGFDVDEGTFLYLKLNKEHQEDAAVCKILMNHTHLDMTPLLQWELKLLPLAVGWFERAKHCTTLSIQEKFPNPRRRVLQESEEVFQSRILTSVYEFVRGTPKKVLVRRNELALAAAYDEKIARLREDAEERDRKITQLEEENERLRGIVELARKVLEM